MATSRETIHSGHFMASNVHENRPEEEEEIDVVSDGRLFEPEVTPDSKGEKPVTFYKFGPQTTRSIAIDTSLLKLNKCIQTAYAQLITPKWKNFKGLKLIWQERIRLNNVIWRAWHAQFVKRSTPKYCFFSVPEEDWHNQTEAAGVMEGIYWKRRNETVCAQYKRWRHFFYKRSSKGGRRMRSTSMRHSNSDEDALLLPMPSLTPLSCLDDDDWNNWFTDTLFSSLGQPYLFPNPKEMAQAGNADFIQPGLVQLQPSLEEIMASLESDGPLSGNNDPALSGFSSSSDLERMNGPSTSDGPFESSRNNANYYTTKEYHAASLLVEYSNSHSGSLSQAGCSTRDFGNQGMKRTGASSTTLSSQRQDFRLPGGRSNNNQSYIPLSSPSGSSNNGAASLCDPYLPQLATIQTMGSQQMQYTLAKTWLGENGNGNGQPPTTAIAGGYDYGNNNQGISSSTNGTFSQTIQLLRSDPYLPRSTVTSVNRGQQIDLSSGMSSATTMPTLPKRGRPSTRKPPLEPKQPKRKSVEITVNLPGTVSVSSTASTVVGIIGSNSPQLPPTQRRKGSGQSTSRKSSGEGAGISTMSSKRRSSSSSVNDIKQPGLLTLANNMDYSRMPPSELVPSNNASTPVAIDTRQTSPKFCSIQPLIITPPTSNQQMGVVRPIPITLSARTDSAFSAISPASGFSPPSTMSQSPLQQRSPGSSTTSSVDYTRGMAGMNDANATSSLVNIGQQSTQLIYGGLANSVTQSQNSSQGPVLILQPFAGMQFPIMTLPYSTSSASSFPTIIPKQEVMDKVSYDPESYASSATSEMSMRSASQSGIAQQGQYRSQNLRANIKSQESIVAQPISKKTAKRPADSTLDPSERKRVQHLHAEQTRRSALKGGFELLEDLLPEFNSTNTKPTNALVLLKTAERLRELKSALPDNERTIMRLKAEIQQMNERISNSQKQMTVSGKSASKVGIFQQTLDNYVKQRTMQKYEFWLMKKILEPMMESYKTEVQGSSRDELLQTAIKWAKEQCTKEKMRPVVNSLLVQLCVETPLMRDPSAFRQYVLEQVDK